ncbi:hypothetical protein N658DRAFT_334132 [Parathielavia hyrcaniae]|uniref:Uncharacterized protein n=1 Tax=Parathielavia hyrcaniae TaxID=113614 RepID=A0AAN6SXS6_9PEZI|nr:hypothetical protein N658DRAFT_334132 [Parathielavia hyrcaniae]
MRATWKTGSFAAEMVATYHVAGGLGGGGCEAETTRPEPCSGDDRRWLCLRKSPKNDLCTYFVRVFSDPTSYEVFVQLNFIFQLSDQSQSLIMSLQSWYIEQETMEWKCCVNGLPGSIDGPRGIWGMEGESLATLQGMQLSHPWSGTCDSTVVELRNSPESVRNYEPYMN